MTGQVPSYLVRNLVEVTLSKSDRRRTRKPRSNETLCLAIPSESFGNKDNSLGEVKALLKLHRRYEIEAERTLYNGVAKTDEKDEKKPHNLSAVGTAVQAKPKDGYLKEIHSKFSLPPSPELPALRGAEQTLKELKYYSEKRSNSARNPQKVARSLMLPALTDKPFNSGENSPRNDDVFHKNPKRNELENSERSALENLNLEDNLRVVPLDRRNFTYYDSVGRNSSTRSVVEPSRNPKPSVGMLISVPGCLSENGMYVNFEDYLREVSDVESMAESLGQGGNEHNQEEGAGELREPSLALVEYKPLYRKNVRFCEDLHEVHLYSPVQNHRRRRRRTKRHTEDDI